MNRLRIVFSKYWFENKRALILLFCAVAAFLLIWMSLYYSLNSPNLFKTNFQIGYYFFGLYISGWLSASFLFADLKSKPRAISSLMVPASQLEKIICIIFFGVFVFWAGYSIVFTAIDSLFVNLSNTRTGRTDEVINVLTIDKYPNPFLDNPASSLYYIYFAVHALFALGSVYFRRYAFFKTLLVLLIFWLVFFFLPIILLSFLRPGVWLSSVSRYEVFDYRQNFIIELPAWFGTTLYLFFCFGATIFLWLATYFKFTERQVA